jgi:hypothetical protein
MMSAEERLAEELAAELARGMRSLGSRPTQAALRSELEYVIKSFMRRLPRVGTTVLVAIDGGEGALRLTAHARFDDPARPSDRWAEVVPLRRQGR